METILEMQSEPLWGDESRSRVTLLNKITQKVYDRFVMPTSIVKNIKAGFRHHVYSTRIDMAEKKCKEEYQNLEICFACKSKLQPYQFTELEPSRKKVCDDCWEILKSE